MSKVKTLPHIPVLAATGCVLIVCWLALPVSIGLCIAGRQSSVAVWIVASVIIGIAHEVARHVINRWRTVNGLDPYDWTVQ